MNWSIYEQGEERYVILPSNNIAYFFWCIYKFFMALFAPFPHNYMRYYKTIENARKELNKTKSLGG